MCRPLRRIVPTLIALLLALACGEAGPDGDADGLAADDATTPTDTGDGARADAAGSLDADDDGDADDEGDADDDGDADSDAGRAADTTAGLRDGPIVVPPYVPGPAPATYDCRAAGPLPARRSPVPIGCPLDPDCRTPMVVGHRGAGGQFGVIAPENSLAAIRAAIVLGQDGVELDVRHTADDGLVLMHDGTVDRTTTGSGEVASLTLAEVTALALRPPAHPTHGVDADLSCARVPTLAEAFALTRDRLFVDLDTKTHRVDLVVAAIREAELVDQVFVSVSDVAKAVEARSLAPEIRVQVRPDTRAEYEAALAALERPPEVVEIERNTVGELAPAIRAAGLTVFVNGFAEDVEAYAADSAAPYLALFAEGADVVQTEYPPLALRALGRW